MRESKLLNFNFVVNYCSFKSHFSDIKILRSPVKRNQIHSLILPASLFNSSNSLWHCSGGHLYLSTHVLVNLFNAVWYGNVLHRDKLSQVCQAVHILDFLAKF